MRPTLLVAGREIRTRVRSRGFLWSTAITLVLILLASLLPRAVTLLDRPTTLAVSGTVATAAAETLPEAEFAVRPADDEAAARELVATGAARAALVTDDTADGPRSRLVIDGDLPAGQAATIDEAVRSAARSALLAAAGVDLAGIERDVDAAAPVTESIGAPTTDPILLVVAFLASLLLFMQLFVSGMAVAQGVVEEKSSRVIELLLAVVTPRQLLVGKVLGIGAVGLLQLALFLAAGLTGAVANGVVLLAGATDPAATLDAATEASAGGTSGVLPVVLVSLVWFLPGYLFYAFAYGAAGSMVSRQEDVGTVTTPLLFLVMGTYLSSVLALQDVTAPWVRWLSLVPPFSALLMPMRVGAGSVTGGELAVAGVLMVALVVVTALLGAGIYRRSVLHTGSRVGLRRALGRG